MPAAGLSTFRCTREGWRVRTLGETGAKETRDLLDERLGRQESVVLLGELLDKLLVLVELLQVVDGHVLEVDLLGTVDVGGIGENADGHAGAGDVGEPGVCCTGWRCGGMGGRGWKTYLTVPEKRLSR